MVSDIKIRNMYSQKLQNKISKIVNGFQILSNFNNKQMGGSIVDAKNKYTNKINNKLNEFVKNSNMLLNFDRAIIQHGGKYDLFTNDAVTVEKIEEEIEKNTKLCGDNIKIITDEIARLDVIEKEHSEHVALIAQKDEELHKNAVEKQQLTSSIDELNKEIEALKAQIAAGVNDKSALEALQRQIDELQAKEKESEKTIQMLDEKDVKTTKELQELTNKYQDILNHKNELITNIDNYKHKLQVADELFDKYEKCNEGVTSIAKPINNARNFAMMPYANDSSALVTDSSALVTDSSPLVGNYSEKCKAAVKEFVKAYKRFPTMNQYNDFVFRKTKEGLTKEEIDRCLKDNNVRIPV